MPDALKDVFSQDNIVIVSTFYPTKEANRFNAFIRNKIACAISQAAFIVEAPAEGGIFEAAKSANKLGIPLFTAKYSNYPENAAGNQIILEKLGGQPVMGRMVDNMLVPNTDRIIAAVKFG